MKRENLVEVVILVLVLLSIIAVPIGVLQVNNYFARYKYPKDAQIINLYGIAKGGIWTRERVDSYNYWWKKFERASEVPLRDDGTPIIFRVTSSDVMHSFAIPLFRIGPHDIKPGEITEVSLKTEQPLRSTPFLCWQYCDKDHENMKGRIIVEEGL